MFDKLEDLLIRYEELMSELSEPDVANNPERFRKLMKEQSDILPIVEAYKEYKQCKQNIEDSLAMLEEESDEEMRELAKEELNDAKNRVAELENELKILLLPKDPNDDKNVIVNGFLMKYGLQGTVVSSTLPKNAGLAALLLLPAVLSGSLWTEISREKKNYTVKDAEYWFCNLLYSVMAGTVVWLLFTHLTWPEGWIPSRWSDFGFWKEKVDQAVAEFKLYLMLPKTVSQTEGMILGGKTVCAGGGSCFLYLLWKAYEKGYDRISDRGRRGKDFPVEQNFRS